MTKKRRTKREKIVASARNNSFDFLFQSPTGGETKVASPKSAINTATYSHVAQDAKFTLIVTAAIIVFNIFVFIALKQNYINLFGLEF